MKKTLLKLFLLVLTSVLIFSCVHDLNEGKDGLTEANLDATGRAFMDAVQTRSGWEQDWREISRAGTPLPNEAVLGKGGGMDLHYIIPIINKQHIITACAIYPFEPIDPEAPFNTWPTNEPVILDLAEMQKNDTFYAFAQSKPFKEWNKKGIELDKNFEFKIQSESDALTRSASNGSCMVKYYYSFFHPGSGSVIAHGIGRSYLEDALDYVVLHLGPDTFIHYLEYSSDQIGLAIINCSSLQSVADTFFDQLCWVLETNILELRSFDYYYIEKRFGNRGGSDDGSGSTGDGGTDPSQPTVPQYTEKDCTPQVILNWTALGVNKALFDQNGFDDFLSQCPGKTVEIGYTIVENYGNYGKTPIEIGTANSINLPLRADDNFNTVACVHLHPNGGGPSSHDISALCYGNMCTNNKYTTSIIVTNNGYHIAMQVENPVKAASFYQKFDGGDFSADQMLTFREAAYSQYAQNPNSNTLDNNIFAFASMLQHFDTGIVIFLADDTFDFKQYSVSTSGDSTELIKYTCD